MTHVLDLHRASPAERAEAFRNFHDIWGHGLPIEEHVQGRIQNTKYENAVWYVGSLDGRVVTACGCYAIQLCIDGQIEPAFSLGEVHTLSEHRGHGFAPKLLAYVERDQHAAGKTVGVLYSDIAPSYYERLGYLLCSCPQGWADPRTDELPEAPAAQLTPCDPAQELASLANLYEQYHRQLPFWVARSSAYWQYLVRRNPGDEFYFLEADGTRIGYLRAALTADELKIRDFALVDSSEQPLRALIAALTALARDRGIHRVGGWMPTTEPFRERFRISDRSRELTMVKSLAPRLALRTSHRAAGEHLHEIDHV